MEVKDSCQFERNEQLLMGLAAGSMALSHFGGLAIPRVGALAESLSNYGLIGCGLLMLAAGAVRVESTQFPCANQKSGQQRHRLELGHIVYIAPIYRLMAPYLESRTAFIGEIIYRTTPAALAGVEWFNWSKEGQELPSLVAAISAVNHLIGTSYIEFTGQMPFYYTVGLGCETLTAWEKLTPLDKVAST